MVRAIMGPVIAVLLCLKAALASAQVSLGSEISTFGVFDGPAESVLGEIGHVEVAKNGVVFITDRHSERLIWLDSAGSFVDSFGRPGDGPSEFRHIGQVRMLPDSRVAVVDEGHRRVVILENESRELKLSGEIRLPLIPRSFCFVDERLFVLGLNEGKVVHEVRQEGGVAKSFGLPLSNSFRVGNRFAAMVDGYSGMGELLCAPDAGMLIVVPHILPVVRAFSLEGELLWEYELEAYSRTTLTQTDRGTVRMNPDPKTGMAHRAVSAWRLGQDRIAIQLVEEKLGGGQNTDLRILTLQTGKPVVRQRGLPLLAGLVNATAIAWEADPFPRVFMLEAVLMP